MIIGIIMLYRDMLYTPRIAWESIHGGSDFRRKGICQIPLLELFWAK